MLRHDSRPHHACYNTAWDTPIIWRVNRSPRISALELGEYVANGDDKRETMRRNYKYERMISSILYSRVNQSAARFLASPTRDRRILADCRAYLEQERDNATVPQQVDNAKYAIRSLDTFERAMNALPIGGVKVEHAPIFPVRVVSGVKMSVQPTVLLRVARPRYSDLRGAIIVDLAKGAEPKGDDLKAKATEAMEYTAMLLHDLVSNSIVANGERASPDHCYTFHTHRQERVPSPANYKREMNRIEAALRTLRDLWASIEAPSSFDPSRARFRD